MILSSQTSEADVEQMLAFYKQQFAVVEVVSCSQCKNFLAFECFGGESMGIAQNELGKYIIPIGDKLMSHRVRLDEAPTGERMVGYQCGNMIPNPEFPAAKAAYEEELAAYEADYKKKVDAVKKNKKQNIAMPVYQGPLFTVEEMIPCGNDTRIADIERGHVPVGAMQTALSPFEKHQIRAEIQKDRTHKADFRKVGKIKHFESFQVERL